MKLGLMAVVAVSGSMAFLVHQVHKRLLSNFMEKFEYEMGGILCAHGQKNLCGTISFKYSYHFLLYFGLKPNSKKGFFFFLCLQGSEKHQAKKKVRFSKEALEDKSYGRSSKMISTRVGRIKAEEIWEMKNGERWRDEAELEIMPPNRKVLYEGIMKHRNSTICGRLPF